MKPGRLFYGFEAETVFDPQTPIEGESLLSLIARTTLENELPNITTILRDVGQLHRNRVVDVMRMDVDVAGLAAILGQDIQIVRSLRAQDVGRGFTHYLGSVLRTTDVHTRGRRFAPASLAKDTVPFYRASWLIRTFPICVETWQVLRTTCECGAIQTWSTVSSLVLCNSCGEDLRELQAPLLSEDHRPGLQFLADILFGDETCRGEAMAQLPLGLQGLDPGEVYELALVMARIVDPTMPNPRERIWREDPGRLARALSTAGPLLTRWPETPWLALEAAGNTKSMLPRCEPLKALYRVLNGDHASKIAPAAKLELDGIRLRLTLENDEPGGDLIDLTAASEILRVGKRKVRATRASGHLGVHFLIRRGEVLPAYSRREVESIAATVNWPSAAVAGKRIGLPPYGVEQLCAISEIVWAKAPYRTLQAGLRIQTESVETLSGRLRASACTFDRLPRPVPLSAVMRGIGGREKPWGPVLSALLNRRWPYFLGRRGCVVREIYVDASDVDDIRALTFNRTDWPEFPFSPTIHQTDACDILNVPNRSRHVIKSHAVGDSDGKWVFIREAVANIAAKTVTSAELQARHFLNPKTAGARIRRARLSTHMFGFERATALSRFDSAATR